MATQDMNLNNQLSVDDVWQGRIAAMNAAALVVGTRTRAASERLYPSDLELAASVVSLASTFYNQLVQGDAALESAVR